MLNDRNMGPIAKTVCLLAMLIALLPAKAWAADEIEAARYLSFKPPGAAGVLHYYVSLTPGADTGSLPTSALIAIHGHPRDANKTFEAAMTAARRANRLNDMLIVAPVFQVPTAESQKCRTKGVPPAQEGDLVWTCASWIEGGVASNDNQFGSFDALDALVVELIRQWPSLRRITVAGFSAGAQMVQHYIGFADDDAHVTLRYVVADPGSWLYFDRERPTPVQENEPADWSVCTASNAAACAFRFRAESSVCTELNEWKYGTDAMPAHLKRSAEQARLHYARAKIHYLEGALDTGEGKGTFYRILDKSCAAEAQGPYRLQRGLAYAAYDRAKLAPDKARYVTLIPDCAHDVACVLPSEAARAALFGDP